MYLIFCRTILRLIVIFNGREINKSNYNCYDFISCTVIQKLLAEKKKVTQLQLIKC